VAVPGAPYPDLLSTAAALHGLASASVSFADIRDAGVGFVNGLWNGGGFCGHALETVADSEYTFYALLSLGHLSPS
jgi:hypothetical protein